MMFIKYIKWSRLRRPKMYIEVEHIWMASESQLLFDPGSFGREHLKATIIDGEGNCNTWIVIVSVCNYNAHNIVCCQVCARWRAASPTSSWTSKRAEARVSYMIAAVISDMLSDNVVWERSGDVSADAAIREENRFTLSTLAGHTSVTLEVVLGDNYATLCLSSA